jgi:histidinol-phosphate/aromatic aminotransferase/cobyric acid decarboxylase-like protein/GNAT superfamily N-acetyltransferase
MMIVALADDKARQAIYRVRCEVYALELAQHQSAKTLRDELDAVATYLTVSVGDKMVGFVSIIPSEASGIAIDNYIERKQLPFEVDPSVHEVRLLTVLPQYRHTPAAAWLMWAALRWVESLGGRRIVVIGRGEVLGMCLRFGFEAADLTVRSGAVSFEVMSASVQRLRRHGQELVERMTRGGCGVEWRLEMPIKRLGLCYHGGAFFDAIGPQFEKLEQRDCIVNADVLDAWFDPSQGVVDTLRDHLPWLLRTSPPTGCEGMVRAIAEARGVHPACVLPGAGSSDLIFLALRSWLTAASRVLILDPMYGEYAHVLENVIGCEVDRLSLRREQHYDIDLKQLAVSLASGRYSLAVLVNPNSPTGRHVDREALKSVLAQSPTHTRVWVDETYIDYVGSGQSLESYAADSEHVVVCKSMSKVYALSGVRAAYMIGAASLLDPLRELSPPWSVSLPGQLAAVRALEDADYYESRYAETHQLREVLAAELEARCGFDVLPGVANFLLCHIPEHGPTASEVVARCCDENVFLRDASGMGLNLGDYAIRIAVKDAATNARVLDVLVAVLSDLVTPGRDSTSASDV